MLRVLNCLESQHDSWLVLLAGCVCLLTSLAAVNLFQRARVGGGKTSLMWLGTAGAVTGCGVWSTHFIAMLAYTPGFPIRYDLTTTVMSLVVATIKRGIVRRMQLARKIRFIARAVERRQPETQPGYTFIQRNDGPNGP